LTASSETSPNSSKRGVPMDKYVEVYTASDITFAYLMKTDLEAAGITVQIDNENLQGAYCFEPRCLACYPI